MTSFFLTKAVFIAASFFISPKGFYRANIDFRNNEKRNTHLNANLNKTLSLRHLGLKIYTLCMFLWVNTPSVTL